MQEEACRPRLEAMGEEVAACRQEERQACSRCSRLRFQAACLRLEEEEEECEQVEGPLLAY
jgi:hypothetical protein